MQQYSHLEFTILGIAGIWLHVLGKLNQLKKTTKNVNAWQYFKSEWTFMIASLIIVLIAVFCRDEIPELQQAGHYLGIAYVAIGYFGQSLLTTWLGKISPIIGVKEDNIIPTSPPGV